MTVFACEVSCQNSLSLGQVFKSLGRIDGDVHLATKLQEES